MRFEMSIKNIEETFEELFKDSNKQVKVNDALTATNLLFALKDNTPVDTGHARDSWNMTSTKKGFDIANPVEYIDNLNHGSSKQAPAFFIETTALKYGTPKGAIVEPL